MMQRLLSFGMLCALLGLVGCSSETSGACDSSDDCPRGEACQQNGTCGEIPCSSNTDCFVGDDFVEACLLENEDGAYDPAADGLCSNQECRGARDCEAGQICQDGICYNGTAGPLSCTCREECPLGEACLFGECRAPLASCDTDCQCPVGSVCNEGGRCEVAVADPCASIVCPEGETCVGGVCEGGTVAGCDPPCAPGESCDETTNTCISDLGALCSPCAEDADCGANGNLCVPIGPGGNVCGLGCGTQADCPESYVCRAPGPGLPNQCLPLGGQCGGCMTTGCPDGQFCDPNELTCTAYAAACEPCNVDIACAGDAICANVAGARVCVALCGDDAPCDAGYECGDSGRPDVRACVPTAGSCDGSSGCPNECPESSPFQDPNDCTCDDCRTTADCPDGNVCNSANQCVRDGAACGSAADCPGGYCQGGVCVDCLTPADCAGDDICLDGACAPCPCPEGQSCDSVGNCVEVADPSTCTSDVDCLRIALDLGFSGGDYACDPEIGCFTIGNCNGTLGGGIDLGSLLGFGGAVDPFDAPCPTGTECSTKIDILNPSIFSYACYGCTDGDDSTCRAGEACTVPLLPLFDDRPSCGADSGGGGFIPGFP
jgi:hypothetical protein